MASFPNPAPNIIPIGMPSVLECSGSVMAGRPETRVRHSGRKSLQSVKAAFPLSNWESVYAEFRAAGERN